MPDYDDVAHSDDKTDNDDTLDVHPGESEDGPADFASAARLLGADEDESVGAAQDEDDIDLGLGSAEADTEAGIETETETETDIETETEAEATDEGAVDEDEDPVDAMRRVLLTQFGDWYVVHSYAGYENKVKTNLESRIQSLDMEDYIYQVEVPDRRTSSRSRTASASRSSARSSRATSWCGWTSTTSRGARSATRPASPDSSAPRPGRRR